MPINTEVLDKQLRIFSKYQPGVIIHLKNSEVIVIKEGFGFSIYQGTIIFKGKKDVWILDIGEISFIQGSISTKKEEEEIFDVGMASVK